jgi:uncharacterized protein
MAEAKAEHEPTMEEILASIRKIISEDDDEKSAPSEASDDEFESELEDDVVEEEPSVLEVAEPEEEQGLEDDFNSIVDEDDDDGILELTERVSDDPEAPDDLLIMEDEPIAAKRPPVPEPEPVEFDELANEPEAASEPEAVVSNTVTQQDDLVSDQVVEIASSRFSALLASMVVAEKPGVGLTLEGLVREMIRPMLKEWLDANLQNIVDEKVEAEITRIVARSRR